MTVLDSPLIPQVSVSCWAFMADTPLHYCMAVGDSVPQLTDWDADYPP